MYSRQGLAIVGRRRFSRPNVGMLPTHYPKQIEETLPETPIPQEVVPSQPIIAPKPKPFMSPPGDMDISAGMPEGFSTTEGLPGGTSLNEAGYAAQRGQYGQAIGKGALGALEMMSAPMIAPLSAMSMAAKKGWTATKGAFGGPANLGSSVPSGTGISGLSGPMGLASIEGAMSPSLADIDIGGFDGGDVGPAGEGGGDPGAMGVGMGLGGDEGMGEW